MTLKAAIAALAATLAMCLPAKADTLTLKFSGHVTQLTFGSLPMVGIGDAASITLSYDPAATGQIDSFGESAVYTFPTTIATFEAGGYGGSGILDRVTVGNNDTCFLCGPPSDNFVVSLQMPFGATFNSVTLVLEDKNATTFNGLILPTSFTLADFETKKPKPHRQGLVDVAPAWWGVVGVKMEPHGQ
jgi:hypothetical protein